MTQSLKTSGTVLWLRLPGLAGTGSRYGDADAAWPSVRRLWPGLPDRLFSGPGAVSDAAVYVPENLPEDPETLAAYLNEVDRFARDTARSADVEAALLNEKAGRDRKRLREELAGVAALGATEHERSEADREAGTESRRAAQRTLAWYWLQQRNIAEIDGLVNRVNEVSSVIEKGYGAETGEDGIDVSARHFAAPMSSGTGDLSPDWRPLFLAVLKLVPADTVFVAEGGMAQDLSERLAFVPSAEMASALGAEKGVSVDFWEALPADIFGARAAKEPGLPSRVRLVLLPSGK